jgi:hypothetical protein
MTTETPLVCGEHSCYAARERRESIVKIGQNDTAVVFIDPQNEVLGEKGAAWAAVGP